MLSAVGAFETLIFSFSNLVSLYKVLQATNWELNTFIHRFCLVCTMLSHFKKPREFICKSRFLKPISQSSTVQ